MRLDHLLSREKWTRKRVHRPKVELQGRAERGSESGSEREEAEAEGEPDIERCDRKPERDRREQPKRLMSQRELEESDGKY